MTKVLLRNEKMEPQQRRFLLLTVGSRGDAEPFCALAAALAKEKQRVDLVLQTDLVHLAPKSSYVHIHTLPFAQTDFYRYVKSPSHGTDSDNPRIRFVGVVADVIAELVMPCFKQVMEIVHEKEAATVDVIVASSLARPLALAVQQQAFGPTPSHPQPLMYWVLLQPLLPTHVFPHYSQTEQCVEAILQHEATTRTSTTTTTNDKDDFWNSYIKLEHCQFDFLEDRLKSYYSTIPSWNEMERILTGNSVNNNVWMVHACSNHLIPKHPDCDEKNMLEVGSLADAYVPHDWTPPACLVDFLNHNHEPVCIGFGSMPVDKAKCIVKALVQGNVVAVLVGKAFCLDECTASSNLYCIERVPYAWLLPQCSMMWSHGGAGVVHATMRAGIPAIVSPYMGDQFFWAKLLEAKGLGVQAPNLDNLVQDSVMASIERAGQCRAACRTMGEAMRRDEPNGAARLVKNMLDTLVGTSGEEDGEYSSSNGPSNSKTIERT